jgi:hypothetical protein
MAAGPGAVRRTEGNGEKDRRGEAVSVAEVEKALASMPVKQKREVAEWLLSQIEDQIPADFFIGLRQAKEGKTVLMEEALNNPPPA